MDLVFELVAVDACAAPTGACWITGLDHEVGDYAVDYLVVVVGAGGEGGEVLDSLDLCQRYVVDLEWNKYFWCMISV